MMMPSMLSLRSLQRRLAPPFSNPPPVAPPPVAPPPPPPPPPSFPRPDMLVGGKSAWLNDVEE